MSALTDFHSIFQLSNQYGHLHHNYDILHATDIFTCLHFYHLFTFRQMISANQLIIDISPIATSPTHRHAHKAIGYRNIRCSPAHRKAVGRKSLQWHTGSPIMGNLISIQVASGVPFNSTFLKYSALNPFAAYPHLHKLHPSNHQIANHPSAGLYSAFVTAPVLRQ